MRDSGSVEEAARLMSSCIDTYLKSVDKSKYTEVHPKYASMLAISGLMQRDLGDLSKARNSLDKALVIQEKIHSQQNLMKAETMCSLATVYHQLGDRHKAMGHLDSAMAIMKDICYTHPITATISCALARVLMDTGDLHSARSSLEEAIKIRTACCGHFHPSNALYHTLLVEVQNQLGDMPSVQEHHTMAKEIYGTVYEREKSLSDDSGLALPVLASWQKHNDELKP
jgi:tetratricopeptide (TPR) repeat protein